jgi:ABC-type transport system involved in multi-copper enzyme maturation permease subunit
MRVLAMSGMLTVVVFFVLTRGLHPGNGADLFVWLHQTLFGLVWILVPLMTADVISRERREGTLGLLFLTPLTASNIVVAKSLAHGLRAFTFCLAVVPVLTIPFLAGGVSWMEAAMSVFFIVGSLFCAIGAGVLASSWCKAWVRALLWSEVIAAAVLAVFVLAHLFGAALIVGPSIPGFTWKEALDTDKYTILLVSIAYAINWEGGWGDVMSQWLRPGTAQRDWLGAMAVVTLFAVFLLFGMLKLAARNVRRTWQDLPPSGLQRWLEKAFCTPVLLRDTLRRWLRWKLERNPIGWLEQRTWSARLMSWSWLAVLVSVYTVALTDLTHYRYHFQRIHTALSIGLFLSMASAAAGSFRRERDNGVLQLLLISPLKIAEIIGGRVRGLWGQFLPAMLLLLVVWLYVDREFIRGNLWSQDQSTFDLRLIFYISTFLATAVVGLYCSLRERSYITALLGTITLAMIVPLVGTAVFVIFGVTLARWEGFSNAALLFSAFTIQLVTTAWCAVDLYRRLERRQFAFAHTST